MKVETKKVTYQLQEKASGGQWKPASYDRDSKKAAKAILQLLPYQSDIEFRIVKKTLIVEVVNK